MFLTELFEAQITKHASFCFGRMNPPTVGHAQLINTVAKSAQGGDYFIFVSQSHDAKKNPLDYTTKIKFIRALFPDQASHIVYDSSLNTIMEVAQFLYQKGYRSVTFVAGSDRLASFKELLTKYNGVEGKHDFYKFDSINFISSGDRDPDAEGIAGVSASAAREAAARGDLAGFTQATGAGKLATALYDAVRKGLGAGDNVAEGWKDAAIGAAMLGTIGGTAMYAQQRPAVEVDGSKWLITNREPGYLAHSKIVTADDGKKYLIWRGIKGRHLAHPIDDTTKQVDEDASGYIPKNKKEAKDPRWSNALTVDVHPDTPAKNLKAFRLV